MNMRMRPREEENTRLIQGAIRDIIPLRQALIWFHTGQKYIDLPKGVPYLVEYVTEGETSYIQTTRLDKLEPHLLFPFHLITTGIVEEANGNFKVSQSTLAECIQAALTGQLSTNFCAVPVSDVERYIEERRDALIRELSEAMQKMNRLMKEIGTYERRAENFAYDKYIPFRRVFHFG
jgi:hypothetical protein